MGHYAKVKGGLVTRVIVAEPDFFKTFNDPESGLWIKTSYNIRGGVYYDPNTNQPAEDQSIIENDAGRKRKNFAGVGYSYNGRLDAFVPPKPYESWVLDENTCLWQPPVAYPSDGSDKSYRWDEETISWIESVDNEET